MEARTRSPHPGEGRTVLRVLGRYQCHEVLGSRPPFETYRARTQGLAGFERAFAVKCFVGEGASYPAEADTQFIELGKRVQSLRDPRLAQIIEVGQSDGVAFIAYEFVFGANLSEILELVRRSMGGDKDALPAGWGALLPHIGAEVAEALAVGHAQQPAIIHGGLSPSNVLCTSRGAVKLLDLGVRAALKPRRRAGHRPTLPPYNAPELALSDELSPASDVYALGAVLFELASGKSAPSTKAPRTASEIKAALAPAGEKLSKAIESLLNADPAGRPTAGEAAVMLRGLVGSLSETETRGQLAAVVRKAIAPAAPSDPAAAPGAGDSLILPSLSNDGVVTGPLAGKDSAARKAAPPRPATPAPMAKASPAAARVGGNATPAVVTQAPPAATSKTPVTGVGTTAGASKPVPLASLFTRKKTVPPPKPAPARAPEAPLSEKDVLPDLFAGAAPDQPIHTKETAEIAAEPAASEPMSPIDLIFPLSTSELEAVQVPQAAPPEKATRKSPPPPPRPGTIAGTTPDVAPPDLSDLTTAELDVMFAAGLKGPALDAGPAAALPVPAAVVAPASTYNEFDEESDTKFFVRGRKARALPDATEVVPAPVMKRPEVPTAAVPIAVMKQAMAELQAEELASERTPVDSTVGNSSAATELDGIEEIDPASVFPATASALTADAAVTEPASPEHETADQGPAPAEPVQDGESDTRPGTPEAMHAGREVVADDDDLVPPSPSRRWLALLGGVALSLAIGAAGMVALSKRQAKPPVAKAPAAAPAVSEPVAAPAAPAAIPVAAEPAAEAPAAVAVKPSEAAPAAEEVKPEPTPAAKAPAVAARAAAEGLPSEEAIAKEATESAAGDETAAVRAARGRMTFVTTPPGAAVWINGAERGHTPVTLSVRPGQSRLIIVRAGFQTVRETVDPAAAAERWEKTLEPTTAPRWGKGNLRVECVQAGKYPISIDGAETGMLCPAESLGLEPGPHEVSIFVPWRNKSYPLNVTLKSGGTKVVRYPK